MHTLPQVDMKFWAYFLHDLMICNSGICNQCLLLLLDIIALYNQHYCQLDSLSHSWVGPGHHINFKQSVINTFPLPVTPPIIELCIHDNH